MLPLDGMRVLEIGGGVPAAFATRWFAGYGADVVRSEGPAGALEPDEEVALLPGKRRIAADDARLRALALAADVVVEDGKPGALAARGLDPLALRNAKPALVITSLTAFGQTGPQAAWEATNLVAHAAGGILSVTGVRGRPPLANGANQALKLLGLEGFAASVTAYLGAQLHGEGDWIDLSAQECAAGMLEFYGPRSATDGPPLRASATAPPRSGALPLRRRLRRRLLAPTPGARAARRDRRPGPLAAPLPRPHGAHEGRQGARHARRALLRRQEEGRAARARPQAQGAVRRGDDAARAARQPGLAERGFFDEVATPGGVARVPGRPFLGLDWRAGQLSAPAADTAAVLRDWLGAAA